jgi:hypothetical protein
MLALPKRRFVAIGLLEALGVASGMSAAGNFRGQLLLIKLIKGEENKKRFIPLFFWLILQLCFLDLQFPYCPRYLLQFQLQPVRYFRSNYVVSVNSPLKCFGMRYLLIT